MTFAQWIAAVLAIAASRQIDVVTTYPGPGLVTFTWRCRFSSSNGVAGAGASMISLTTPEAFTALWVCSGGPGPAPIEGDEPRRVTDRRGRYVPRVPARAVGLALQELFK